MDEKDKDFEQFYISIYGTMLYYCKSCGQKNEDADEIVDEAFVRMCRAWDRCSALDSIRRKKWIFSTIDNIIRERRKKHTPVIEDIDDHIRELEDEVGDELKRSFENIKFEIYVDRIKEILPPGEWDTFEEIVIKQHDYKEAAERLGRSISVVYLQMERIRKKIEKKKKDVLK